jgi:sRNA-binding carbon storage regulator CsrA
MLKLTRRIGETIYIGDTICLTVYDKLCYHVMLGVLTPPGVPVRLHGVPLRAAVLGDGAHFYLLTLLSQDRFTVGEAEVEVAFKTSYSGFLGLRNRLVKIGIDAPRWVTVDREEIYVRKLVESGRQPPDVTMSAWMRGANLSVSCRAAA